VIAAAGFAEQDLRDIVNVAVRVVEAAGAVVIVTGAAVAFIRFLTVCFRQRGMAQFAQVRLDLGRFLALGIEFQLAADILRTAVSPTFKQLAQLAAVAGIRTALNFFLSREIKEQRELVAAARAHGPGSSADSSHADTTHPGAPHADARGSARAIRAALAPWAHWRDPR
jgi:uncharacterized membrane protein